MSNQVGTVEVISPRGKAWNAKIDGVWYGLGFSKPEIAVGNKVEFEVVMNGAYKNAKDFKVLEATVAAGPSVGSVVPGATRNYDSTQKAIQFQASRNAAIQVAGIALQAGLIKLPAAANKQLDVVLAFIDEVTERYDTAVTDHVAGVAKAAKKNDDDEDEEME